MTTNRGTKRLRSTLGRNTRITLGSAIIVVVAVAGGAWRLQAAFSQVKANKAAVQRTAAQVSSFESHLSRLELIVTTNQEALGRLEEQLVGARRDLQRIDRRFER